MTTRTFIPRIQMPTNDAGQPIEPEPVFDDWDQTPHGYFIVPVTGVRLGDVLLGTHQINGIGQANQRGAAALRLDLDYIAGPSEQPTARMILPLDQQVRVKRYIANPGHRWAYVNLTGEDGDYPAGLVPDYGSDVESCCTPDEVNPHGYDTSGVMCNECAPSWATDHRVVRHHA